MVNRKGARGIQVGNGENFLIDFEKSIRINQGFSNYQKLNYCLRGSFSFTIDLSALTILSGYKKYIYFGKIMLKLKRLLTDPTFYGILALNIYFIFEFQKNPAHYNTIIWLYWSQSIIIGFFTFLELTTTKNFRTGDLKVKDAIMSKPGCSTGVFFLLHYGFFHLVYFLFLGSDIGFKGINMGFFKTAILAVSLSQLVYFLQHKLSFRDNPPSLGSMFVQPYIRIIPMHLTILLPAFIGMAPSLVFIVLRTILDVVGYVVTAPWFFDKKALVGKPDAGI
jgi:hypothetical protein